MTLLEFVQKKLSEFGTDAVLDADTISRYLLKHRYLDYQDIYRSFDVVSLGFSVNTSTGVVTATMRELYETYEYYAGPMDVFMHPQGFKILADEEEVDPDDYQWDPAAFTLKMNTPFAGETTVQAVGHIVNILGGYGVMYDCIEDLEGPSSKLLNTRGQEIEGLRKRLGAWKRQYTPSTFMGGWRARG